MTAWEYPFNPHAKQERALKSTAREILYGGAVAGGKSEVLLAACIDLCTLVPGAKALLVRRTTPELRELKERLRKRVPREVAVLKEVENTYYFRNGSMLIMAFLDSEDDATKVQGFELQLACFDELTHYEKSWYVEVLSRLRATGEVKDRMEQLGFVPRALSASNPGGRGHAWVKERFVDPAPMGQEFDPPGDEGGTRLFIQATLYDNPFIDHADYIRNSLGGLDPERKRALLEGDWAVPAGVRFPQFREQVHTLAPEDFPIDPVGIVRTVGVDFGFSDPYAAVWLAKIGEYIVAYRDDVRDELTAAQQAERILELEAEGERAPNRPVTIALDPAAWRRDPHHVGPKLGGEDAPLGSMAWHYQQVTAGKGGAVVKGINAREHGWATLDELLLPQETGAVDPVTGEPETLPRLLIYNTCRQLIRALQSAPRSKTKPEDVDTKWKDDHVLDALRYGIMDLLGREYVRRPSGEELARRSALERATETGDLQSAAF